MKPAKKEPLAAKPIAFLSDVHGNLPALEAVLTELKRREITTIYVAGDLLYGGDEPLRVWQRLEETKARCTWGPSDVALATVDPEGLEPESPDEAESARRFGETRRQLGDLVAERLRRLPERIRIPLVDGSEVLMVHGSPADAMQELSHDLSDAEMEALLGGDPADVVICGATHVPHRRQLEDVCVVNVGSVGAAPEGAVAHYTVLTPRLDGIAIEQAWVRYGDVED